MRTDTASITVSSSSIAVLHLPLPPSVNRTRRAHGRGIAELESWHQLADKEVLAAAHQRAASGAAWSSNGEAAAGCRVTLTPLSS